MPFSFTRTVGRTASIGSNNTTAPSLLSQPVSPVSSTGASAAIDPPSSLSVAAATEHQQQRRPSSLSRPTQPPPDLQTDSSLPNTRSAIDRRSSHQKEGADYRSKVEKNRPEETDLKNKTTKINCLCCVFG